MTDGDRHVNPLEQVLDLCLYAPLGFALEARSLLPRLVDRGRSQIVLARVVGKYTLKRGNAAGEALGLKISDRAMGTLRLLGAMPGSPDDAVDETGGAEGTPTIEDLVTRVGEEPLTAEEPSINDVVIADTTDLSAPAMPGNVPVSAADLAIPDYDSLSASQVVPRLESLAAEELEDVRAYEAATRGRKTILNRVAQLQSA